MRSIVILGGFGHEGVAAQIESLGFKQRPLRLDGVGPNTWLKRAAEIDGLHRNNKLAGTIIHYTLRFC